MLGANDAHKTHLTQNSIIDELLKHVVDFLNCLLLMILMVITGRSRTKWIEGTKVQRVSNTGAVGSEAENNSFQKVFYGNYESLFVCITGENSRDLLGFGNP